MQGIIGELRKGFIERMAVVVTKIHHIWSLKFLQNGVFYLVNSFFFFYLLKWGRGLKSGENFVVVWSGRPTMLQVSLYSLPEKHSAFIGSIFSSLFHLYVTQSCRFVAFSGFSTFLSETVFLNLHVNCVAFSEERLSLFFIIYMIILPFAKF